METKFQTSFIPKQPVTETVRSHTSTSSIFFLLAFIFFMASLAGAGGVLIYERVIERNIALQNEALLKNKNAFDPNTVVTITRLHDRINSASTLLRQHKRVSSVFELLSDTTLENIQFTDFNYTATDDKINVSMKGVASGYETVALQSKAFTNQSSRNYFRSPIFGDLNLDQRGNVSFTFNTGIDPFLVDYYRIKSDASRQGGFTVTSEATPFSGTNNLNQ
jgi:hypothetical protein